MWLSVIIFRCCIRGRRSMEIVIGSCGGFILIRVVGDGRGGDWVYETDAGIGRERLDASNYVTYFFWLSLQKP